MTRSEVPVNRRAASRSVLVVAIAAIALVSTLSTVSVFWVPRASLGFALSGTSITAVAPHSTAALAGLKPGDHLDPSTSLYERLRLLWYDDFAPGEAVPLRIVRDGSMRSITIAAVPHAQPFSPVAAWLIIVRLLSYVVFIVVGASLVLLKPARFSWGFFLCCLGLATLPGLIGRSASVVDPMLGFTVYGVWLLVADLANVGFLAFALRFPTDEASGWRLVVWRALPLLFIALAAADTWSMIAWYSGFAIPGVLAWAGTIAGIGAWAVATLSLAQTYRESSARNRKRLLWAIVGSSVGFASWYADAILQSGGFGVAGQLVGFGTLALPLSVGYAVLKHRVVNVRFALNRALIVGVVATSLIALLAVTYWATTALLPQSHLAVYIQVAIALLAGLFLRALYLKIKRAAARLMFRDLSLAQAAIGRAAAACAAAESYETLEDLLSRESVAALDLTGAAVFRRTQDGSFERTCGSGTLTDMPTRFDSGDALIALMEVNSTPLTSLHVGDRGAALALPVFGAHALRALVLFGPHQNGLDIDPDEARVLASLGEPSGDAYRRLDAHALQVRKLATALRDWDRGKFFDYLADQIVASLPPSGRAVLFACAAVPDATERELALVSDSADSVEHVGEIARTSPFIERTTAGRYVIHAQLREALVARLDDGGSSAILRCAADALERSEFARAADLYTAMGDSASALAALEALYRTSEPLRLISLPETHARMISAIPADALAAHPNLLVRRLQLYSPLEDDPDVIDLAMRVLATVDPGDRRRSLACWLAFALSESGDAAGAEFVLSSNAPHGGNGDKAPGGDIDRLALGLMLVKKGSLDAGEALMREAGQQGASMSAAFAARARGRWTESHATFYAGIEREPSASPAMSIAAAAETLITAWLGGDDRRCADVGVALAAMEGRSGVDAVGHLVRNSAGGADEPPRAAHPRHAAYSFLMRAAGASDAEKAAVALRALERAAAANEPLVEAHVLVCLGELEPGRRLERVEQAAAALTLYEDSTIFDALGALATDAEHCGILEPLVGRFRKFDVGRAQHLAIDLAGGVARSQSTRLGLAEGELALLFALARTPGSASADELIDALWPGHDPEGALRALQSCVYRLRTRLGDPTLVESVTQGYQLRSDVSVDLWSAEQFLSVLNGGRTTDRFTVARLERLRRTFGRIASAPMSQWEWFAPVERRIAEVARTARVRLAETWLHAGQPDKALECARELIKTDDLDEAGWEFSIRAHVAAGSTMEGRRDLRAYRELLARELAAEPPAALEALVASDGNGLVH